MKYELDILESIIKDTIDSPKISKKQFKLWRKTIHDESGRIKKAFVRNVFSLHNEHYIELYIRNHQSALIRLSDKVFENMNRSVNKDIQEDSVDSLTFNLLKLIYINIDLILSFIKSHFSKYFNHHDKIPEQYRLIAQKELREQNRQIYCQLKSEENCPLLEIAFLPVKKFHEFSKPVSFQRLVYSGNILVNYPTTLRN